MGGRGGEREKERKREKRGKERDRDRKAETDGETETQRETERETEGGAVRGERERGGGERESCREQILLSRQICVVTTKLSIRFSR